MQIIGHRGARGLFPENTLAGVAGACAIGVDAIEFDVRLTADSVVVVHHDSLLNPETTRARGGTWLAKPGPSIAETQSAALAAYDVGRAAPGSRTARRFPHQTPIDGARIPRLDDVLALRPRPRLLVELKPAADPAALADAVAAAVRAAAADAVLESFDWRALRHLQRAAPDLPLAWLTEAADAADAPERVAAHGGQVWCPSIATLTRALMRRAKAAGLRVVPWTVNAPSAMRRLLDWGADGLITDYPDRTRELLAQMGLPLPMPVAVT
ncbi:MAG TPA: glycerophosphodiester phosphodiesterase family protein [Acidisphaera sp.]|nr:glycerophosphodiester phosphodiesterase family protein [Acidisphaera sp.]